jgi:hypothetical protein
VTPKRTHKVSERLRIVVEIQLRQAIAASLRLLNLGVLQARRVSMAPAVVEVGVPSGDMILEEHQLIVADGCGVAIVQLCRQVAIEEEVLAAKSPGLISCVRLPTVGNVRPVNSVAEVLGQ